MSFFTHGPGDQVKYQYCACFIVMVIILRILSDIGWTTMQPTGLTESTDIHIFQQTLESMTESYPIVSNHGSSAKVAKLTIFTLIGIEGSGHHLFQTVLQTLETLTNKHHGSGSKVQIMYSQYSHLGNCRLIQSHHLNQIIQTVKANAKEHKTFVYPVSTQLSYPCGLKKNKKKNTYTKHWPNMIDLMEMVINQSTTQFPVDLKFIVLKRDWVECVVSACIHRGRKGGCKANAVHQLKGAKLIASQLQHIPQKYWIVIDYHDFVRNPESYADIISRWLNINDAMLVKQAFVHIKSEKGNDNSAQIAWNEMYIYDQEKNETGDAFNLSLFMAQHFYDAVDMRQCFWNDGCYKVSPNNTQFMGATYLCA
eukprot:152681_1